MNNSENHTWEYADEHLYDEEYEDFESEYDEDFEDFESEYDEDFEEWLDDEMEKRPLPEPRNDDFVF